MAREVITTDREVVETQPVAARAVEPRVSGSSAAANIIYVVVGILEVLLLFRFVFQLLGANPNSGFVNFIYALTGLFVAPFYGIFGRPVTSDGTVTTSVFDPSTLVAMVVYALVGWAIVKLLLATRRPAV